MKIATISCRETEFPIERDQLNNVNDLAGSWCFGSRIHFPLRANVEKLKDYDAVWFTMSKQIREYELRWMELLTQFKEKWPEKKVILHQEGEAEFYLMRPSTAWNIQRDWVLTLKDKIDLLLTHNARDASLYRYFVDKGEVEAWRTVQDVDKITPYLIPPSEKAENIGISTYDGRAGGLVGLAVASKVYDRITQVTRSVYADGREGVFCDRFGVCPTVTRQSGWFDWLKQITDVYFYLHPMPAASAGRDTIACAALGIPVIGNKNLDAQMHLFPELAVDVYDTRKQEELVRELLYSRQPRRERKVSSGDNIESDLFTSLYDRSRNHGLKHCKFYGIDYGVERAKKIMQRLGW